jgi:hypothetical protein
VVDYIDHRIRKVGSPKGIFERKALARIAIASGGIPRAINQLCDAALVYGYGYNLKKISLAIIDKVIAERGGFGLAQKGKSATSKPGTWTPAATSANQDSAQSLEDRVQALERSLVALAAGVGKTKSEESVDTAELKRRLNFARKRLAEERFKRNELTDEIKALKRLLDSLRSGRVKSAPKASNVHTLSRKKSG